MNIILWIFTPENFRHKLNKCIYSRKYGTITHPRYTLYQKLFTHKKAELSHITLTLTVRKSEGSTRQEVLLTADPVRKTSAMLRSLLIYAWLNLARRRCDISVGRLNLAYKLLNIQ